MAKRKIDESIKLSPEVESAIKGFKPRFGSQIDIDISNEYGYTKYIISLMKSDEERLREMGKIVKTRKKRLEEIERREQRLLSLLRNRA